MLREAVKVFMEDLMRRAIIVAHHSDRSTVSLSDIEFASEACGMVFYADDRTPGKSVKPSKSESAAAAAAADSLSAVEAAAFYAALVGAPPSDDDGDASDSEESEADD